MVDTIIDDFSKFQLSKESFYSIKKRIHNANFKTLFIEACFGYMI